MRRLLCLLALCLIPILPAWGNALPPARHAALLIFDGQAAGSSRSGNSTANASLLADFSSMGDRQVSPDRTYWASSPPLPAQQAAGCLSLSYRPSALLNPKAEERRRQFFSAVADAACGEGVSLGLIDALFIAESSYNPVALSPKGAFGLGQLMPATAQHLGIDRFDLRSNVHGAARYLRELLDEFRSVPLALAAYNAGPERVHTAHGLPALPETLTYVQRVLENWRVLEIGAAAGP